jgi:hypothetical protein
MTRNLFLALVLLAASKALADPPHAAAAAGSLGITFVDGGNTLTASGNEAWLDLDRVGGHSAHLRRRIGVQLVRDDGSTWGSASLIARLDATDGRSNIRIDGRPLPAGVPLLVEAHAAVGRISWHTLEVDVPPSAAEGALSAAITWEVQTP